jgi:hypothetical protein
VADLEEEGEAGGRLDVRLPHREDRLVAGEGHLRLGADIGRFVRHIGDQYDEGGASLDRGLQILGIVDAGADIARRDPGLHTPPLDERAKLVRFVAILRSVADEDVAGHAPLVVTAARL